MNCIMSNQWERRTTEQLNEQKEQIDQLSERLTILQETLNSTVLIQRDKWQPQSTIEIF